MLGKNKEQGSGNRGQRGHVRILFFGDVVGRIARRALAAALPVLKKRYHPQLVIANVENAAHGLGLTADSWAELRAAGIDVATSGDNIWSKDGAQLLQAEADLLRPANYPAAAPGRGALVVERNGVSVLVVNLLGRLFIKAQPDNPFAVADRILRDPEVRADASLVDYHAEATSEKAALAWYLDGRVSAVLGTHTHVQTADDRILPQGTAFLSDVGMCGAWDSIIGTDVAAVLAHQRTQLPLKHDIPEHGVAVVQGAFVEVDGKSGRATRLTRIQQFVDVQAGGKTRLRKGVRV